jgi:isopentenyl diphosphate isomerase/L-lactate dehydrogenase-like FMN-dependent dehydrogenase
MPIREALPRIVDLRDQRGCTSGSGSSPRASWSNPADIAWAICAGADFVTSARGFMFFARLHPGAEMQPQHLPDRHHHP